MANILRALQSLKSDGGFSFNLNTGALNPDYGFMVAVSKDSERLVSNVIRYRQSALEEAVRAYINENAEALAHDNAFLGGWIDNGTLYLDVSELVPVEVDAIALCQARKQLAYFNNGLKKTVYLPKGTHTGGLHNSVGFSRF